MKKITKQTTQRGSIGISQQTEQQKDLFQACVGGVLFSFLVDWFINPEIRILGYNPTVCYSIIALMCIVAVYSGIVKGRALRKVAYGDQK